MDHFLYPQANTNRADLTQAIVLGLVLLLGTFIRLFHLLQIDLYSPFFLGGLFAEFAQQIFNHNFSIPPTIPFYTNNGIPFAYPPLSFYVLAFLIHVLGLPEVPVINLLPPVLSILSLVSFWYLTSKVFSRWVLRIISLLIFATLPAAYTETLEAAGLAEGFGMVSMIWLLFFLFHYLQAPVHTKTSNIILGAALALCMVSSPGSAYGSIVVFFVFSWFFIFRHHWSPVVSAPLLALLFISPYLIPVLLHHSTQVIVLPFLAENRLFSINLLNYLLNLFSLQLVDVKFSVPINVLIASGLCSLLCSRKTLIIALFFSLSILPREGLWLSSILLALLAGSGASFLIDIFNNLFENHKKTVFFMANFGLFFSLLIQYPFTIEKYLTSPDKSLHPDAINVMNWARHNTPSDASFLILSNPNTVEWFPRMARRTVLNMPYGSEWDLEDREDIDNFVKSSVNCDTFACFNNTVMESFEVRKYYLILTHPLTDRNWIYRSGSYYVYK